MTSNRLPILAAEIAEAHALCRRAVGEVVRHAVAAGRRLLETKELVPHGQWGDWLATNVPGVSVRTAQRYMRAARRAGKSDTVSFSTLRELLGPKRQPSLAQAEWLFTFDADAKLGSTPVPLDEPSITRLLRDAHQLMDGWQWNLLLGALPEGRVRAIAREIGAGGASGGTERWFDWAHLNDPEDCWPGEAWFPVLMLGRHYPDQEKDLPADKRRIGVRFEGSGLYHLRVNASPVHLMFFDQPDFPDVCTAILSWKLEPRRRTAARTMPGQERAGIEVPRATA